MAKASNPATAAPPSGLVEVRRYDFAGAILAAPHPRPDGSLLCEAVVCREGILEYRQADGSIRRELVTREAVDSTAKSIGRAAVTDEHPPEFVTPDNVGEYGVGDVDGEVYVEEDAQGGFCKVRTAVRRRDAIDGLRSKRLRDVSPGYTVRLDMTPGEHPTFGAYDARQMERTVNHLALTARGRGTDVPIRADSLDAVQVLAPSRGTNTDPGAGMNPKLATLAGRLGLDVRTDMADGDLIDMIAAAVMAKMKEGDDAVAANKDMAPKADMDKMEAERDALKAERDALKAELDGLQAAEQEKADAAERTTLADLAGKLGVKLDSGSDLPVCRRAIAATVVPEIRADASDDYIAGLVEAAKVKAAKAPTPSRYDAWGKTPAATPKREDAASVPYVDGWTHLDSAHTKTHGGVA